MAKHDPDRELREALPLVEEAAHLLRHAPPRVWTAYLIGTVPFVFGLVQFWSQMDGTAASGAKAVVWALVLATAHLWMRVWQSRFGAYLLALRSGQPPGPWSARVWARVAANQAGYGVFAFLLLLPAAVITLPFGWVYGFYQNLAVVAHTPYAATSAWRTAHRTPYQNHAVLAWLSACWLLAFVNVFTVVWALPQMVKWVIPVEWAFTRYPLWVLSSTALCVIVLLTYLVTDPLVKAIYALRVFYGLSLATGADVLTDWRRLTGAVPRAGTMLSALVLAVALAGGVQATEPTIKTVPAAAPVGAFDQDTSSVSLPAGELDMRIERALRHTRYDWRFPAETTISESWMERQIRRLCEAVGRWTESVFDAIGRFFDWLGRLFHWRDRESESAHGGVSANSLSWVLAGLFAVLTLILLVMLWRSRKQMPEAVAEAVPQVAAPDVSDESVTAEVLPEEEWVRLAGRLRAEGAYRKAARALFLAVLACLARREVVVLAAFKSNADYLRELRRRTAGGTFDERPFRRSVGLFEACWYGDHAATPETLDALAEEVEVYRHA